MPGANLKSLSRHRAKQLLWKYLVYRDPSLTTSGKRNRLGRRRKSVYPVFLWKNGAPVSFQANDQPDRGGQICIDILNKDVYIADWAFIGVNNGRWTKISD